MPARTPCAAASRPDRGEVHGSRQSAIGTSAMAEELTAEHCDVQHDRRGRPHDDRSTNPCSSAHEYGRSLARRSSRRRSARGDRPANDAPDREPGVAHGFQHAGCVRAGRQRRGSGADRRDGHQSGLQSRRSKRNGDLARRAAAIRHRLSGLGRGCMVQTAPWSAVARTRLTIDATPQTAATMPAPKSFFPPSELSTTRAAKPSLRPTHDRQNR